ncbi:MAG TPA: DNA recombination protein RmuC [Planctomycetota bacterium]|nr:DNA recombination protein RmuC [Planctomycetota bacterium]
MIEAVYAGVGALAGGVVVWFVRKAQEARALGAERESRVRLETQLVEARKSLEEQRRLLDDAQGRLENAFKAMAAEALRSSNAEFLRLAEQTLKGYVAQASGDLDLRKKAVEDLVKPIQDSLKAYQEKADVLERERQQAYGGLSQMLQTLSTTQERLKLETGNLVAALRSSNVRGRWGELTLRRVVELAGMVDHCDFKEQATVEGEDGALRPDLVVHLPNKRDIVVDAKAVLAAYLDAQESTADEERKAAFVRHAAHLRERVRVLSSKRYWASFAEAADFVVLFVPGEPFLAAAAAQDPSLLEDALANRVVVATPTTLVALLKAVAFGWQQERMAQNAQEVAELGKKLFEGVSVWAAHLQKLRDAVFNTVEHFNAAQASLERHVLPRARRMKELGVGSDKEVLEIKPVDKLLRSVDKAVD